MILGKKSDVKNHLSAKRPTWSHKVMAHNANEQNLEMKRREEPPPATDSPPKAEQRKPLYPRY